MAVTNVYPTKHFMVQAEGRAIAGVLAAATRQGYLTDALVGTASYDTVTEVTAALEAKALANPVQRPWIEKVKLALAKAKAIGLLSETHTADNACGSDSLVVACSNDSSAAAACRVNTWF